MTSWRIGSFLTSTHTSSNNSEVRSFTSLCLNVMKPPFLQDRACVTSNDAPQIHWDVILSSGQLYLILMASQNSRFVSSYPSTLMGKFGNQFEIPFWLRVSIVLFDFSSDFARNFTSSLAIAFVGFKSMGLKVWRYSCRIFVLIFCYFCKNLLKSSKSVSA